MSDGSDRRIELLAPAGNEETLRTAIRYGADAVYLGGEQLSLRARAQGFSVPGILDACRTAHENGVRVYVTANIYASDTDIRTAEAFFTALSEAAERERPDALLIADPGMLVTAKRFAPGIPVHLSTQANTTNAESCRFWMEHAGIRRFVLARELSLECIAAIRGELPEEATLECFVHGAMCISYSGKCLLSRAMTGREANRGACAHPCRYDYALLEEKRPGEYFPVEESDIGTQILASDDLCMLAHLPELAASGAGSLKIEGRMKNALYVAAVTRAYRLAIDAIAADPAGERYRRILPALLGEVRLAATRPLSTGFYFAEGTAGAAERLEPAGQPVCFLGVVEEALPDGRFTIRHRNRFAVGEQLVIMKKPERGTPQESGLPADPVRRVASIAGADGVPADAAIHPGECYTVTVERIGEEFPAEAGDVLYRAAG